MKPKKGMLYSCGMIPLGTAVRAVVKSISPGSCTLEIDGQEVPMNIWELPAKSSPGRELEVFVYNDSKESLKATRMTPFARLHDFAPLKVKVVNDWGAFLEWGLPKDLFLPSREQTRRPQAGEKIVVQVVPDHEGKGLIATAKLNARFDYNPSPLAPDQEVRLLVFEETKLGFGVVVENRYRGLLYKTELFEPLSVGDLRRGVIKKIRDDGRIDCALQAQGFRSAIDESTRKLLDVLGRNGGFLPLHDKSSPEEIAAALKMSKKNFKRASGVLFRERRIRIEKDGIRLVNPPK